MYDPHGTHRIDNDVCGTRREGTAINSTVAQQPPTNTTDLPGPLVRPLGMAERLLYIRKLRKMKRAPCLVPKLSKTGRVRHLQAGEKKSQNQTGLKKQSLLASTANKDTEAPVLGWPARPWQPTMHRGCDGGETPRERRNAS